MSGPEDNPADDDPHHECRHEIDRLAARLAEAERLIRSDTDAFEADLFAIGHATESAARDAAMLWLRKRIARLYRVLNATSEPGAVPVTDTGAGADP